MLDDGNAEFSLWAKAEDSDFPDDFRIYVAKTADVDLDFLDPSEWTPVTDVLCADSEEFQKFTVDLRVFAGQEVYVAIRHADVHDDVLIMLLYI